MQSRDEKTTKQPYHTPQLLAYGDIREITMAVASTSKNADGGKAGANKTS
jgi:hypothetical protein